ncbi:MAG: DUF2336 domain-containing protein [Bauldia sp.]
MFEELKALAAERSDAKRTELLSRLADVYAANATDVGAAESELFSDIFAKIIDSVSKVYRVKISNHMAPAASTPRDIAVRLANDDSIEVAAPMLEASPVLTDDDLVAIANSASQDHLAAIAGREIVAAKVTDVLVDRGDRKVVHKVSANPGAAFSESGMNKLIVRAESDNELQTLIADRNDLSPQAMRTLVTRASNSIVAELERQGCAVTPDIPESVQETMRRALTTSLANRRAEIRRVNAMVAAIADDERTASDAIGELLDADRFLDIAALVAQLTKLEHNLIFGILAKGPAQQVMLVLRSLDVSWAITARVLDVRDKKGLMPIPPGDLSSAFNEIEVAQARRLIRFMKLRKMVGAEAEKPAGGAVAA